VQLEATNALDGAGQIRVTGGNLYLGRLSADGTTFTDAGILFEGATSNAFTTRLQAADPSASRTITLPNASGSVALVAGSSNQVQYNSSGALAGSSAFTFDGSNLTIGSQGDLRLGSSGVQYFAFQAAATMANSNIYTLPAAVGTANQVLQIASVTGNDATLQWATVSGGGSPGGSTTQIQFNDAGAFAGDSEFTWDKTGNILGIGSTHGLSLQGGTGSIPAAISSVAGGGFRIESGTGNLNLEAAGDIMNKGNRIPKVFSGTSVPSNALGSDGDVYFKY
jgi:hypothetical protein